MQFKATETFDAIYNEYLKFKYRFLILWGGSRSGKTWATLQLLVIILLTTKKIKITVWRNTRVTCRDTVMDDFETIISDLKLDKKIKKNGTKGMFTVKSNGSRIIFEGADQIGKVLGSRQDISYFNEVTEFNEDVYKQIAQRTSNIVLFDYNPSKSFWLDKFQNNSRAIFLHSNFEKNYACPIEIVKTLLSYEPWEHDSYEVRGTDLYYNNAIITETNQPPINKFNEKNGTIDKYMWLVYGLGIKAEKPEKVYNGWKRISLQDYNGLPYKKYYGLDFGLSTPMSLVEVKFDGDMTFYIKKKLYKPAKDEGNFTRYLNDSGIKSDDILVCDSAKQHYIDLLLRNGYYALGAEKGADSVSAGITILKQLKIYYVEDDDIDAEYSSYCFAKDRYGLVTDEVVKRDDHLMDAIRYIITYLYYYFRIKL